jgi:2,3-bisphosphoglycerate-dependent phosphoglycerate mutase
MAVGLHLESITDEVGSSDFFHAFFSTVSGRLEPAGWGSRFPILTRKLYKGELRDGDASAARAELVLIRTELGKLRPDKVIWDIDDRSKQPPWGSDIAPDITSLANYFVTSTGRDLIDVLFECIDELQSRGGTLEMVQC